MAYSHRTVLLEPAIDALLSPEFGRSSGTAPALIAAREWLGWEFGSATTVDHYTLTVVEPGEYSWEFQMRSADGVWATVARARADFRWERQTRVFAVDTGASVSAYRLVFAVPIAVAQMEFLRLAPTEPD